MASGEDPELGKLLEGYLQEEGIDLHSGVTGVERFRVLLSGIPTKRE